LSAAIAPRKFFLAINSRSIVGHAVAIEQEEFWK
jgi:hypothetical protein